MERDLLPWILSGVLITSGAIAAAIEFGHYPSADRTSPSSAAAPVPSAGNTARLPGAATASMIATPAAAPAAVPPSALVSAPLTAPGPAPGNPMAFAAGSASSELPPGEVWQCVVNGQKIFSDKRCGTGASVRELGDLNVMDTPAAPPATDGLYRPGYGGSAYPSAPYPDDQDDTGNAAADGYAGPALLVARERARREHLGRQDNHVRPPNRGASGSRNPH